MTPRQIKHDNMLEVLAKVQHLKKVKAKKQRPLLKILQLIGVPLVV